MEALLKVLMGAVWGAEAAYDEESERTRDSGET